MNIPILLFGIVLSTLFGAIYHFWKGGDLKHLLLFTALSWVGFWAGQIAGSIFKFTFGAVGVLNTGMAIIGSIIFMVVGEWLSLVEVKRK